ncbi:hypothetical protein AGMMS50256_31910 [Betaproteobacteria bacterium]|nr:hypothetical protein AGMMS50256_31910 [Betaproteobacteria bacterium]
MEDLQGKAERESPFLGTYIRQIRRRYALSAISNPVIPAKAHGCPGYFTCVY